jgi:hypothetical protein
MCWKLILEHASNILNEDLNSFKERNLYFDNECDNKRNKKHFFNDNFFVKIDIEDWNSQFTEKCYEYVNILNCHNKIKNKDFCIREYYHHIDHIDGKIIRIQKTKFIKGKTLIDYPNQLEAAKNLNYLYKFEQIIKCLYKKNIKHVDLSIDHNIIIDGNDNLILIDYESMYCDGIIQDTPFNEYMEMYMNHPMNKIGLS